MWPIPFHENIHSGTPTPIPQVNCALFGEAPDNGTSTPPFSESTPPSTLYSSRPPTRLLFPRLYPLSAQVRCQHGLEVHRAEVANPSAKPSGDIASADTDLPAKHDCKGGLGSKGTTALDERTELRG